ncbi:MAG: hypothetical protein PHE47_02260 [Oscillospiraceae bacterium]|nr:hypothetical protein [Oscillospiraceae bacterium]
MKIGKMFKWYWQNTYWGLIGFYGAMLALMLLGFTIIVFSGGGDVTMNGFSCSSEVMLLVMGIIFFSAGTRFGLSNGVSRKTVFCGMALFMLTFSAGTAVINVLGEWTGRAMGLGTVGIAEIIYPWIDNFVGRLGIVLSRVIGGWAMGLLGYFIGGAYYRMNKIWKIIVSITVPALLVFGLPLLVVAAPSSVTTAVGKFFPSTIDWLAQSPYNLTLLWLGGAILCGIFSWLLIRRAPVKIAG